MWGVSEVSPRTEATPMSDHPPIVAGSLRVHGPLHRREREALVEHWAKLDQRLQSFRDRSIDLDLHVSERDTASQHVTLDVQIGGFKPFVAKAASKDLTHALNVVRDEMIRQLTDAKNRTEPRNNRRLRDSARGTRSR
jgi:ribosome-associated translation inhibitor RaiA